MDLTKQLLVRHVATLAGLSVGFVATRAVGLDPDIGWAILVFAACAVGGSAGIVSRNRATLKT